MPNPLIAMYRSIAKVVGVDCMERERERQKESERESVAKRLLLGLERNHPPPDSPRDLCACDVYTGLVGYIQPKKVGHTWLSPKSPCSRCV